MKDKIEKMYTQALIDDLAPNVFAEQIMSEFWTNRCYVLGGLSALNLI